MTTGSWDRSSKTNLSGGGFVGVSSTKTWSGTDRPIVRYPVDPPYVVKRVEEVLGRNGKIYFKPVTLKFPKRRSDSRPPKRVRDEEHPYTASIRHQKGVRTVYNNKQFGSSLTHDVLAGCVSGLAYQPNPLNCPAFTNNDQARLIQQLRALVEGSDFNLANLLGESLPAIRMITDSASRIYGSLRALRKGNIIKAHTILVRGTPRYEVAARRKYIPRKRDSNAIDEKDMSSAWLELQYGWLPLLKDVEAGAHYVAHHMSAPFKQAYKARRRLPELTSTFTSSGFDGWDPVSVPSTRPTVASQLVTTRQIKAILTEKPGLLASLGLLNPETVAWEIMPWSFIIDWFIPIGEWMQARAFANSVTGTFVTTDVKRGLVYVVSATKGGSAVPQSYIHNVNITRSVSTSLDVGLPAFKPLSSVPSWTRMGNAIALLVGLRS